MVYFIKNIIPISILSNSIIIAGSLYLCYQYYIRNIYYLLIELGGTNYKLSISNVKGNTIKTNNYKTDSCYTLIENIINFVKDYSIKKISIASFGPLILDGEYRGTILNPPSDKKTSFKYFNIIKTLSNNLKINENNIYIITDVMASALGEYNSIKDNNIKNIAYITIGTGVGVGLILNGKLYKGYGHTEGGHIIINNQHITKNNIITDNNINNNKSKTNNSYDIDKFNDIYINNNDKIIKHSNNNSNKINIYFYNLDHLKNNKIETKYLNNTISACKFHDSCVEGLSSNIFIWKYLNRKDKEDVESISPDHEIFKLVGKSIGILCANINLLLRLDKIIIGGGIINSSHLLNYIKQTFLSETNNYILLKDIDSFIVKSNNNKNALQGCYYNIN